MIEVIDDAGETTTFYADKGWLYSAHSSSWREVDDEFRERFRCFLDGGTAPWSSPPGHGPYEPASVIVPSDKPFGRRGEVFVMP